ncbi:hypothetical protein BJ322DRAFT_1114898 [Thelephora terrestris]|uniref:Uncharacterized protein n=1 Tax=Thelephora terrestris TaxID=56493 RepID=A0A9P6H1N6_9AGAM|nr:hypothetical protein BJ322DRAFT_1114898 [Thelephora terrestris]
MPKKSEKPRLNPDPDLVLLPDVTSVFHVASTQSPQLPIAYDNLSHPTWMELFPDVEDDIFYTSPSATSHHLPPSVRPTRPLQFNNTLVIQTYHTQGSNTQL